MNREKFLLTVLFALFTPFTPFTPFINAMDTQTDEPIHQQTRLPKPRPTKNRHSDFSSDEEEESDQNGNNSPAVTVSAKRLKKHTGTATRQLPIHRTYASTHTPPAPIIQEVINPLRQTLTTHQENPEQPTAFAPIENVPVIQPRTASASTSSADIFGRRSAFSTYSGGFTPAPFHTNDDSDDTSNDSDDDEAEEPTSERPRLCRRNAMTDNIPSDDCIAPRSKSADVPDIFEEEEDACAMIENNQDIFTKILQQTRPPSIDLDTFAGQLHTIFNTLELRPESKEWREALWKNPYGLDFAIIEKITKMCRDNGVTFIGFITYLQNFFGASDDLVWFAKNMTLDDSTYK